MKAIVYKQGSVVTINRELYEVEAMRLVSGKCSTPLAGQAVYSLLKIKDGTRWRITARSLQREMPHRMVCVGRCRKFRREHRDPVAA